jgi:hypothetical protein
LTPTASRENISAIIELMDEKGSRVIGAALRSGGSSLRDEAAIFAQSASLRRAGASGNSAAKHAYENRSQRANVRNRVCSGGFIAPSASNAVKQRPCESPKLTETFYTSNASIGWKCPFHMPLPHGTNSDFQNFML